MGYTDVFGGETIFPSLTSYLEVTFAVDITLQWAREQQIAGDNVVADFMDMDATAGSLNVDMPSASATGTGNKATFNNIGSNTFSVRDVTGGAIISVAPGEQWIVVLTDNTTEAGTWTTFQLGATVSVANASALAGAGIKAISTTLNQMIDSDIEAATPFSVVDGDRAKCLIYTGGVGTCNLPAGGTVGNDWFFMLRNSGSGTLNVVPPAGTIDGGASINLDPNVSCFIFTDGANFFTIGLSTGSTIAFDFVQIAVPGSGDFVLSGANLDRISYRFTGALTGNRRIVVPNTTQQYWVDNQTTGAFDLTISTAAQASPPAVVQGNSIIFYCDGTDVINAVSQSAVAFPITVGQGGTGATTPSGAQTNLQVPPISRALLAGLGINPAGLGDLSADRTIAAFPALEAQSGVAEIATQAEVNTGTDDTRIVTPLKLANATSVTTRLVSSLSADEVRAALTIADSALSVTFGKIGNHRFRLGLKFSTGGSSVTVRLGFNGTALDNISEGFALINQYDEAAGLINTQIIDNDLINTATFKDITISATSSVPDIVIIEGSIDIFTVGTFLLRWGNQSGVGTATLAEASYLEVIPTE